MATENEMQCENNLGNIMGIYIDFQIENRGWINRQTEILRTALKEEIKISYRKFYRVTTHHF